MDFGLALSFPFKQADWPQKILVAALIMLVPVFGWLVVFGWSVSIAGHVIRGEKQTLPPVDFLNDMLRGAKGLVINLVYSLPALLVFVPVIIIISIANFASESHWFTGANIAAGLCLTGAALLYTLALMFILPAAYGHLAARGESLGAALNIRAVVRTIRRAPTAYVLVAVGQILSAFIALLGSVACVVGLLLTTTYTFTVMGHLYGQAYQEAQAAENNTPPLV